MKTLVSLGALGLLVLPQIAEAGWLEKQRKNDPVHSAVAAVAQTGCTVSNVEWDRLYASFGGREQDGDYHILKMYEHKELTSKDGGFNVTFTGVAGCP